MKNLKYYKFSWKYQGRKYEVIEGFPKDMNVIECWASFFEHTSKTCYSDNTSFDITPLRSVVIIK